MLFFKRIGTERRNYTITLNPMKLEGTSGLNTDISFAFVRGNQTLVTAVYKPNNRQVVFKDEKLEIRSTMYYNTQTRIFIEKPATIIIKGKQLGGNEVYEIDTFEFDLAEYIGKAQQRVKFQFDSGMKLTANLEFVQNQKNFKEEIGSTATIPQSRSEDKENKGSSQTQEKSFKDLPGSENRRKSSTYLLQTEIKQKDKQIEMLREQNKRLTNLLDTQSQPKPNPAQTKSNQELLDRFYLQNAQLNKRIVQLEIQLSKSQGQMKKAGGSEVENQKTIKSQARRIRDLEDELEESKNKMAVLLQDCFQQGDADLMSFIEQRLKK